MIFQFLSEHHIAAWLLIGLVLIVAEMFMLPGLGMLFVGLGALSVGLLEIMYPKLHEMQYIIFIVSTLLWFMLLWKPMNRHIYKKHVSVVPNIIGSKVKVVHQALEVGSIGQVEWSGTVMNAKLSQNVTSSAKIGTMLEVVEVQGNVLVCVKV